MPAIRNNIISVLSVAKKYILIFSTLLVSCASQQQFMPVYEISDPERNLHSYMMSGNFIQLDDMPEGYHVCSLNPGRIHRGAEGVYFALNLVYKGEQDSIIIGAEDSLILSIDGSDSVNRFLT